MEPRPDRKDEELVVSRKSPFAPIIRLCPRCLKPLQRGSKLGGWLVPQDYVCPSCGYRGTVFLEKDLELNTQKKDET